MTKLVKSPPELLRKRAEHITKKRARGQDLSNSDLKFLLSECQRIIDALSAENKRLVKETDRLKIKVGEKKRLWLPSFR